MKESLPEPIEPTGRPEDMAWAYCTDNHPPHVARSIGANLFYCDLCEGDFSIETGREYALELLRGVTWLPCPACGSVAQAVGEEDDWLCGVCGHAFEEVRLVPPQSDS